MEEIIEKMSKLEGIIYINFFKKMMFLKDLWSGEKNFHCPSSRPQSSNVEMHAHKAALQNKEGL